MDPHSKHNASTSPPSRPIRKRRRVPLACSTCRDRKTRCDGAKPTCATCNRKGIAGSCVYGEETVLSQKHQKHLEDPRQDASVLERIPAQLSSPYDSSSQPPLSNIQEGANHGSIDGLGTTSANDHVGALYGSSSAIAFVSSVENATAPGKDVESSPAQTSGSVNPSRPKTSQGIHGLERLKQTSTPNLLLPPRHIADEFLSCYWKFVHPLFPIIRKSSFNEAYQQLWDPSPRDTTRTDLDTMVFNSTLNLMLALGCQFSPTIPSVDRSPRADEFYQQSRQFISFDILDSMHLSLVQMFLLTGVYLQSTKHADRCWNVVGLAIRVAYGLGLHVESGEARYTVVETELRRRIWHICVMLDRLLAMTFGRPTMITRDGTTVPTPQLIEDEYPVRNVSADQMPSLGLFVYSLKLYDILDTVLATFYLQQDGSLSAKQRKIPSSLPKNLTEILNLNAELDDFQERLPAYLKFSEDPGQNKSNELQINVLHCRFLYVRILLLRRLLFSQAKENLASQQQVPDLARGTLQSQMVRDACTLCLRTARELIGTLYDTLENPNRSSPWHSVYFAFAGAMILVTSRLCSIDSSDADEGMLRESWQKCMHILRYHKSQVHAAVHAMGALEKLWVGVKLRGPKANGAASTDNEQTQAQASTLSTEQQLQATFTTDDFLPNLPIAEITNQLPLELAHQTQTWDRPANEQPLTDFNQPGFFDSEQGFDGDLTGIDDVWFTQNFLETDWLDMAREDGGGFFF